MKKINFGFKKKQKNNDVIVKRNWKKVWIWTTVVLVLIGAIIPAIYIPVRNHNAEKAQEPMPSSLNAASVNEAIDKAEKAENATEDPEADLEDQVWGLYIDIEENEKSDFAIYGGKTSEGEEEGEFDKDKFDGPFSKHVDLTSYEWLTFWDQTSEDATEMLAEFIWEINKDSLDEGSEYGTVTENYFHISLLDGEVDWETFKNEDNFEEIKVNKVDKNSEGEEEDTYELTYGPDDTTSVSGPMWLTFKGDDLVFVVTDIAMTVEEGTITESGDFDKLMEETGLYNFDEDDNPAIKEN